MKSWKWTIQYIVYRKRGSFFVQNSVWSQEKMMLIMLIPRKRLPLQCFTKQTFSLIVISYHFCCLTFRRANVETIPNYHNSCVRHETMFDPFLLLVMLIKQSVAYFCIICGYANLQEYLQIFNINRFKESHLKWRDEVFSQAFPEVSP